MNSVGRENSRQFIVQKVNESTLGIAGVTGHERRKRGSKECEETARKDKRRGRWW